MDEADRNHRSSPDTSFWLVDKVVAEPLLSVGTVEKDLQNSYKYIHMHGINLSFHLVVTYIEINLPRTKVIYKNVLRNCLVVDKSHEKHGKMSL